MRQIKAENDALKVEEQIDFVEKDDNLLLKGNST